MLPSSNISTTLVANTLGSGSNRALSYLCKHPNINKWAKYKPIRYNTVSKIGDTELEQANYGFDMYSVSGVVHSELYNSANSYPNWKYDLPRGISSEPYRLGDFAKYEHNAEVMYNYSMIPTVIKTTGPTANALLLVQVNARSLLRLKDFNYFNQYGGASTFRYGILLRKKGQSNVDIAYGPYITDSTLGLLVEYVFPSDGTYDCLFVATRSTSDIPEEQTVFLPGGRFSISVERIAQYATATFTNESSIFKNADYSGIYIGDFITLSVITRQYAIPTTSVGIRFIVKCFDRYGSPVTNFVVEDPNSIITYYGTDRIDYTLDYLAGGVIAYNQYAPGVDGNSIKNVVIEAETIPVSGNGFIAFNKQYRWVIEI